jgi:hypothetical protein
MLNQFPNFPQEIYQFEPIESDLKFFDSPGVGSLKLLCSRCKELIDNEVPIRFFPTEMSKYSLNNCPDELNYEYRYHRNCLPENIRDNFLEIS